MSHSTQHMLYFFQRCSQQFLFNETLTLFSSRGGVYFLISLKFGLPCDRTQSTECGGSDGMRLLGLGMRSPALLFSLLACPKSWAGTLASLLRIRAKASQPTASTDCQARERDHLGPSSSTNPPAE